MGIDIQIRTGTRLAPTSPLLVEAFRFSRQRWLLLMAISCGVLVPCFWHKRIEAGDLGSHTYNAWLAQLIRQGQAPSLYLAHQSTNLVVDIALTDLGSLMGFTAAEKIVVSACVLTFFWGAFALISVANRRAPWFLVPAIAMVAYGWTFQMGFLNYYLSLGLAFLGVALFWRGRGLDYLFGLLLGAFALLAHPMGLMWLVGTTAYLKLAQKARGTGRWACFAAALLAILALHFYVEHHYRTLSPVMGRVVHFTGGDQLSLFSARYRTVKHAVLLLAAGCFLVGTISRRKDSGFWQSLRPSLELWAMAVFATAMLWSAVYIPIIFGGLAQRFTSITAILGLCILGGLPPRKWHLVGFAACAAVFFTWLYQDTALLNGMEAQAEALVKTLPFGRRVMATIAGPSDSSVLVMHIVDRACIGRCFTYSNFEPPLQRFRVRAMPGSPLASDSLEATEAMETGTYIVRPEDLPVTEISQCDESDLFRLCARDLAAGETNGRWRDSRPPVEPQLR